MLHKIPNNHRFAKHLIHLDKFPAVKYTNMRKPFLQNFERTLSFMSSDSLMFKEYLVHGGHDRFRSSTKSYSSVI